MLHYLDDSFIPHQFDLFQKDIILVPINHNNSHWTAAAINFRRKRIESYDSMNMDRRDVYKVKASPLNVLSSADLMSILASTYISGRGVSE